MIISKEGSNNATKKHCAAKSNLYIHMITFIRHFPLVVPIIGLKFGNPFLEHCK